MIFKRNGNISGKLSLLKRKKLSNKKIFVFYFVFFCCENLLERESREIKKKEGKVKGVINNILFNDFFE